MLSTWETFARKRVERGIEIGEERERERWRAEREEQAKRIAELEKRISELEGERG